MCSVFGGAENTRADVWQGRAAVWREDMYGCVGAGVERGRGKRDLNTWVCGWVEDLHVDASAVVGERGERAPLSRGADKKLGRRCDRIIVRRAPVRG